jgi:cell division protease FtsH
VTESPSGSPAEGSAPGVAPAARPSALRRVRSYSQKWLLRRRRKRAARKRGTRRRSVYALLLSLFLLLGAFYVSLSYVVRRESPGRELSVDQLSALADEHRIESARFLDQDAVVMGTFSATSTVEEQPETTGQTTTPEEGSGDKDSGTGGSATDAKDAKDAGKKGDAGGDKSGTDGSTGTSGSGGTTTSGGDTVRPGQLPPTSTRAPEGSGPYWVAYPSSDALTALVAETVTAAGARVTVDPQSTKQAIKAVTTFLLPLMILANLFGLLFSASRGGGSGIGSVMMFGTIGSRRVRKGGAGDINFDSVAGADEAVAELREVRDYLQDPARYEEIGATPPKGVLLVGPPGCGKTLLAKAVAGEAGVPFFSVAGAEFVESLVGVGAARVRDLFQRVRLVAPAIVFIDELDAAGRKRGAGGSSGGSDEREQTLNQMLVEMDGFDVSTGIVVIGATNRPDILDPALLRPGRFDRHVTIDQPDSIGRQQILELHAKGKPISSKVEFEYIAKRTPGFSGADLANVLNEAALLTVREGKPEIEIPELEEAIQRVLAGPKKRGRVLSEDEERRAAYHESGHAVVAAASGRLEDVHRVSILARGKTVASAGIRSGDSVLLTRSQIFSQIVTAMGGIAAEEIVFGEPSTGAEEDLERATNLARDMVGRFGMGSKRRRLLSHEIDEFLGGDVALSDISPETHHEMEDEIDRMLVEAENEASRLLLDNRSVLEGLAERLVTEETLEGEEVVALLQPVVPAEGYTAPPWDLTSGNGRAGPGRTGTGRPAANRKRAPSKPSE